VKILILANHFITLFAFRRELIARLIEEEHELILSLPPSEENAYFREQGCRIIETPIDRRGINPFKDLKLLQFYKKLFKERQPGIIFSYTVKPNIYGALASKATGHRQVCNITGTGGSFLRRSALAGLLTLLYRRSIGYTQRVFFQNTGDMDFFKKKRMVKNNGALLPGSGVNLDTYSYSDMPLPCPVIFLFAGRIMEVKGIDQFLEAAQAIRGGGANAKFLVAGFIEQTQYEPILKKFMQLGIIEYIGFKKDLKPWLAACHAVVLPSHGGEGVPNVLLEAAAMGRVCIASNINGSRDAVDDGVTGYLFEKGNSADLIEKIERFLALTHEEKQRMGQTGRAKVEREFDREIVIRAYLEEIGNIANEL
jgi:galacturonosyltransferase